MKTAADACQGLSLRPESEALIRPNQSPTELSDALVKNRQCDDAVKVLAHGMPERQSVWWATQSAQQVTTPSAAADLAALEAAQAWVKNPTDATAKLAADAAAQTDFKTPAAWAAQAAAFAQAGPPGAAVPVPAAALPPMPNLVAQAVVGAVMLAAAKLAGVPVPAPKPEDLAGIQPPTLTPPELAVPGLEPPQFVPPKPEIPEMTPKQMSQTCKALKPFLKTGHDIAEGKNTWA